MANEYTYLISSSNNMYAQFIGGGGYTDEFGVGYSQATGRKINGALRFPNVTIAKNTSIYGAELRMFVEDRRGAETIYAKVWGIDEDNTSSFSSSPLGRTKTSASNTHYYTETGTGGYFTIGVGNIVQEIVNRGGWSSGNAMGFIIEDNNTTTNSPGNFIYEYYNTYNSYLEIRLAAAPNLKPTPTSISAPTFPAAQDYGIKISKPNVSVLTATDAETYFTTRKNSFKIKTEAEISLSPNTYQQYAHGLGYSPAVLGYINIAGARYKLPRFDSAYIGSDNTNVNIYSDRYSSGTYDVYYYCFIDPLKDS